MNIPYKWREMRFPDSNLVSLLHKIEPRSGYAVDIGCGSGRHVKLLNDIGFNAIGVENDEKQLSLCHENKIDVINAALEDVTLQKKPVLIVAWGVSPLGNVTDFAQNIGRFDATWLVIDWRNQENSFYSAKDTIHHKNGLMTIGASGNHLAGLNYRIHKKNECHIQGYDRIFIQKVTIDRQENGLQQVTSWYQTIHKLTS